MTNISILQLSMYLDQHGGGKGRDVAKGSFSIPFKNWTPGYVLVSSRSDNDEEWVIKTINSADGKPHREDCLLDLINKAGELRQVKGSTAQGSYAFKSTGDVEPPTPEERTDVKPFGVSAAGIREFYPRSQGEGTRLIMHDKTVYIVLESFPTIWQLLQRVGVSLASNKDGAMTGAELQGN